MGEKEYKFGIIRMIPNEQGGRYRVRNIGVCHCGQCILGKYDTKFECNSCGNDYFINAINYSGERFVVPYIEVMRRDVRGFKVKRINLSITYSDGVGIKVIKENLTRTVDFDIIDKRLKIWREEELEFDLDEDINRKYLKLKEIGSMFFRQMTVEDFLDRVSDSISRGMYELTYRAHMWGVKGDFFQSLTELMSKHKWSQILVSAGIPKVNRFNSSSYYYRNSAPIDRDATKPHQILKVPKFMMQYIREDVSIDRYTLSQLQNSLNTIDVNKVREIMSIVKDEGSIGDLVASIDDIMQIHIDYEYKNLRKLVLYLFREVKLTQGIDRARESANYLRDYIRMSRSMGLSWEKYPKSLKKEHDIVAMNYSLINAKSDRQKEFEISVSKSSYQNLSYKNSNDEFVIIAPTEAEDLVREGNQLSHCVASYVKDVIDDRCKILFLRNVNEVEKPLATIEVRGVNIRQARGYANKQLSEDERTFVSKWAETKGLAEAYY